MCEAKYYRGQRLCLNFEVTNENIDHENWCALFIAIAKQVTPEQAYDLYWEGRRKANRSLTKADVKRMVELRKTHTCKEIGEMYGLTANAVFRRVRYFLHKY